MTPEEMLEDLETCLGPCGKMCISCPEGAYVDEIHRIIKELIEENKKLRSCLQNAGVI